MNYRLKAALAAVALTIIPGAVFAQSGGWIVATGFNGSTTEVTGVNNAWSTEIVRHVPGTMNKFIGDPSIIPPGPCKAIAIKWNMGVFTQKPRRFFLRQIDLAANFNCSFQFVRDDVQNALGSYDLISIAPSP